MEGMYSQTPPPPPPKPLGNHESSRRSTPAMGHSSRPPPPLPEAMIASGLHPATSTSSSAYQHPASTQSPQQQQQQEEQIQDPGPQYLPSFLSDKSKSDLSSLLTSPSSLSALTNSPQTSHPSIQCSHAQLQSALNDNISLATNLLDLEAHLTQQRAQTQAQLLSTHALERQWRAKQAEMDHSLSPFAPVSLYQRLSQSLQEQEGICYALEESFLEGGTGEGVATEKEVSDWIRRYREAKKLYYLRQERKERWDEGRVGGWR
ncbi:hypothetical protein QBC43DRAFT_313085 [Cladorrhinum sp. PSN259]|nr:hypothetical protein QBC43DRAFT_313085 [Cladorrhinum sp. PSN259]